MKKFEISFRPLAEADLFGLYRYFAEEAGHEVAGAYIDRIEAACMALETFPKRGTRRDDIRAGLRTMGFERRGYSVNMAAPRITSTATPSVESGRKQASNSW